MSQTNQATEREALDFHAAFDAAVADAINCDPSAPREQRKAIVTAILQETVVYAKRYAEDRASMQQAVAENVREGHPYDDPRFEELCRDYSIWGTAESALCAVFWRGGQQAVVIQPAESASDKP